LFIDWVSWQRAEDIIFSSSDDENGRKIISFPDSDEEFLHVATQGVQEEVVFSSSSSSDDEDHKWR